MSNDNWSSNDQRSDVKTPNNSEYKQAKENTVRQKEGNNKNK